MAPEFELEFFLSRKKKTVIMEIRVLCSIHVRVCMPITSSHRRTGGKCARKSNSHNRCRPSDFNLNLSPGWAYNQRPYLIVTQSQSGYFVDFYDFISNLQHAAARCGTVLQHFCYLDFEALCVYGLCVCVCVCVCVRTCVYVCVLYLFG